MARLMPYAGTSHDRLTELIKTSQPKPLPQGVRFVFRNVVEIPSQAEGDTRVSVTPYLQDIPKVEQQVLYYRLPIDVLHELPEGSVLPIENIVWPTTLHEILPILNEALGLDLLPTEVENYAINEKPVRITLRILPGNLAWIPGPYYFNVDDSLPEGVRITQEREIRVTHDGAIRIISP